MLTAKQSSPARLLRYVKTHSIYRAEQFQFVLTAKTVTLSPCITSHYAMKTWGGGADIQVQVSSTTAIVVSFMPGLLYPREKNLPYSLDRRLDGPQRRFGRYGFLPCSISDPSVVHLVRSRYTDYATAVH